MRVRVTYYKEMGREKETAKRETEKRERDGKERTREEREETWKGLLAQAQCDRLLAPFPL